MDLIKFQSLGNDEQWDEFWERGRKLAEYGEIEYSYSLFSLHGFLVELTFDGDTGKTLEMNAFIDGQRLDKYIDEISNFAEQLKKRK